MSFGAPSNLPQIITPEDYQSNLARIEKARKVLDAYAAMNEDAKKKYEEYEHNLARRIAEGEKARQELELLRSRNAPLAITAPPATSTPQISYAAATPVARIEEIPSHSGQNDQNMNQRAGQPQSFYTFYNNTGTTQEQPVQSANSIYTQYHSEPSSSQIQSQTHIPSNQPPTHNQVSQSVWHRQSAIQTHHSPHVPQMTQQKGAPQHVRKSATVVQQRQVPQNTHQRPTVTQQQHQQAPVQQLNTSSGSLDPQVFASVTQNHQFVEYLRAAYPRMKSSIPMNSYFPVSNTPYYIVKQSDQSVSLVVPNAQGNYIFLDVSTLLAYTANMTHVQEPVVQYAPVPQTPLQVPNQAPSTKSQGTRQSTTSSQSRSTQAQAQAQLQPPQAQIQLPLRTQVQLQPQPLPPQTQPQRAQTQLQVQTQLQAQPLPESKTHPTQIGIAPTDKLHKRIPANVDKSHLARDILRALGVKRSRPSESSLVAPPAASAASAKVVETLPEVELASATIIELSPEPEPTIETVKESANEPPATAPPMPMHIDLPISAPTVESPLIATIQSFDLQNNSDNAMTEPDHLTIQEEAIIPAVVDHKGASARTGVLEEDEIQVQEEGDIKMREEPMEEGEVQAPLGSIGESRDGRGLLSTEPLTLKPPTREEDEKALKTPLFLPSPSSSLQRSASPSISRQSSVHPPPDTDHLDEDISMDESVHIVSTKRGQPQKSFHRRALTRKQPFYILIPSPPSYVIKYKEQEARRRRKRRKLSAMQSDGSHRRIQYHRSTSQEDTVDTVTISALKDSTTRLTERRCKWNGCDVVMNSSQNLFKHLQRHHSMSDFTKKYMLCHWTGCGDHVPRFQIDQHLGYHAFFPLSCPYQDCEESFRVVQSLKKHNVSNHSDDSLKRTPEPFAPAVKEPLPIPSKVPAYMINSGLVRQESIPQYRRDVLAPWVYNNIAGPSLVTKRYNAAKGKPLECEIMQTSSQQFSANPSKPAKTRDIRDLASVEVSGMVSGGLVIWPPRKPKMVVSSNSENESESKMPQAVVIGGSEEDGLRVDNVFADDVIMGQAEIKLNDETIGKIPPNSSNATHQASEEEAVETMLTGQ